MMNLTWFSADNVVKIYDSSNCQVVCEFINLSAEEFDLFKQIMKSTKYALLNRTHPVLNEAANIRINYNKPIPALIDHSALALETLIDKYNGTP